MEALVVTIPLDAHDKSHPVLARRKARGIEVMEDSVKVELAIRGGGRLIADGESKQSHVSGPAESRGFEFSFLAIIHFSPTLLASPAGHCAGPGPSRDPAKMNQL